MHQKSLKRHGTPTPLPYPYPYPYPDQLQCLQQALFRWVCPEFCQSHVAAGVHWLLWYEQQLMSALRQRYFALFSLGSPQIILLMNCG